MNDFDAELQQVLEAPAPVRRRQALATPPWSPGLEHDGNTGTLTSGPVDADSPDWDAIFAHWNLSPDEWDVDTGSLRVNAWEGPTADGTTIFRQYKATIRRRTSASTFPVDDALRSIAKWRPTKPKKHSGTGTFVVCCADWQVGGGSTSEFLERFSSTLEQLVTHAKRASKEDCDKLVVLYLGDMVENTTGNYSSQLFEADITLREQIRVVRQCETAVLRALSPLFTSTQAVAVAGNHGRSAPKVLTTPEDNADLIAFEGVAEVLTESGAADTYQISFIAPETRSVALVETSGTNLLVSHGDQVGGSAEKVKAWWHKTAFQRWGDADLGDILVTGHRHHFRCEEVGEERYFIVCPTLGPESRWFGDIGGGTSLPGTLVFRTEDRHWWAMNNLRP